MHKCFPLCASSRASAFRKMYIWAVSLDIWTIWLTLCICRTVFHPARSVQHRECRSVVAILAAGGLRIGLTDTCSLSSLSKIPYCSFRLSSDILYSDYLHSTLVNHPHFMTLFHTQTHCIDAGGQNVIWDNLRHSVYTVAMYLWQDLMSCVAVHSSGCVWPHHILFQFYFSSHVCLWFL